jgi:copper chaperone CopZ
MTPAFSVAHYSPGRLRLKAPGLARDKSVAERIEREIGNVPGIVRVHASRLTGSILIEFSPERLAAPESGQRLLAALAKVFPEHFGRDWIATAVVGLAGRPTVAARMRNALAKVRGVRETSIDRDQLMVRFDADELSVPAMLDGVVAGALGRASNEESIDGQR